MSPASVLVKFGKASLYGVGQVMLQKNAGTGFLFLCGIFFNSVTMGMGAILGVAISTGYAMWMNYPPKDISDGLYGFNGVLVGIAIWYFYDVSLTTFLFLVLAAMLSSLLMFQMKKFVPPYTAPFVISTWIVIFVIRLFRLSDLLNSSLPDLVAIDYPAAIGMSFGQVMFQVNLTTGFIFLIGILINSKIFAVYAVYGSLLSLGIAILMSFPVSTINLGVWGYNAILCAIALGNKKMNGFLLATAGILISVFLNGWLGGVSVIALTAPFVIATWIMLGFNILLTKRKPAIKSDDLYKF